MAGYKHAALMALFAADAAKMEKPWKNWEVKHLEGEWTPCPAIPSWHCTLDYRQKPRTINVNGKEVNAPIPKDAIIADYPKVWVIDSYIPYCGTSVTLRQKSIANGMAFASEADVLAFLAAVNGD